MQSAWVNDRMTVLNLAHRLRALGHRLLIGMHVDIAEMKQTQQRLQDALAQAEAASRAKSEFLANVSHEIRTPLNGVIGMTHVLAQTGLTPTQRKLTQTILEAAGSLEVLLGDLLDLTRIEAGRLEVRGEAFDLREMVKSCAAQYAVLAEQKGVRFRVFVDPALPEAVIGDAARLRQVIGNLLSNAVKFTAQGEVTLSVAAGGRDSVVFEVRDTGIGFEAHDAERLFGRFVQADGSLTRQYGGSGLGLAICRELMTMMGGVVTAKAEPGKGAAFRAQLPLPQAKQMAAPAAA